MACRVQGLGPQVCELMMVRLTRYGSSGRLMQGARRRGRRTAGGPRQVSSVVRTLDVTAHARRTSVGKPGLARTTEIHVSLWAFPCQGTRGCRSAKVMSL